MKKGKRRFSNWLLNIVIIIMLISVVILFINERWVADEFLHSLLLAIAISAMTTGIFSIFNVIIENLSDNRFSVLKKCDEYGLVDILTKFPLNDETIKKDFLHSKDVIIVMNDGKNFISANSALFNQRLDIKDKITNFILLNYEENDLMNVLTRKNGHMDTPNYYSDKIKNVISYELKKRERSKEHILNVYLNSNYNTMAMILTDNYAMISLFRISSGKDEVPHMIFKKGGSEYEKISGDINRVIKEAKALDISN